MYNWTYYYIYVCTVLCLLDPWVGDTWSTNILTFTTKYLSPGLAKGLRNIFHSTALHIDFTL
jgi:hypothetical protein